MNNPGGVVSRMQLRFNFPNFYKLLEELFGSDLTTGTFYPKTGRVYSNTAKTERTTYLPNTITMAPEYGSIRIDYGDDVKCTEDRGISGQTTGANQCIKTNADGTKKTTKIEYVQKVIKTYIDKMKAQKVDITPSLRKRGVVLFMFNKSQDKGMSPNYMFETTYGQDLQADETFVLKDSSKGYSTVASKRNAAMEEIIHMLQNNGITPTKPDWQKQLDDATTEYFKANKLNWFDTNGNGLGGDTTDDDDLPRADLDDEMFADGVEAYFDLRGGKGYVKTSQICISRNCTSPATSKSELQANLPKLYTLIQTIFGTNTTFNP